LNRIVVGLVLILIIGWVPRRSVITHAATPIRSVALALSAAQGARPASAAPPYLIYHGGEVMPTSTTYAVFWLPPGRHFQPDGNDAQFEAGVAHIFQDIGGTHYYNIVTQYSKDAQGSPVKNGPILSRSTLGGSWIDPMPYPHAGSAQDPFHLSDYRDEVRRAMAANAWTPGIDKIFFVYTADDSEVCGFSKTLVLPGGEDCTFGNPESVACAGHDYFMQGAQPVLYAAMPEPAIFSCKPPPGPPDDPNNDVRMDAAIALGAVNLLGAVIDPLGTGWYHEDPAGDDEGACEAIGNRPANVYDLTFSGSTDALFAWRSNTQDSNCVVYYPDPAVTASLKAKNLHPKQQQTLRITTVARAHVEVDLFYHNGSSASHRGQADASGRYRYTWRVRNIGGRVDVAIIVATDDGGAARITRHFDIR
jgi:hypothetical protein